MERHASLPVPSDLEKLCHEHKNPRNPKFGLSTHLGVKESVHIQLSDHCDLDFLASVLRKMCCLVLSNDFP